jgi:tetratricopeptide (TPR) repeat protein
MKRVTMILVVLALATIGFAQQPAGKDQPPAQSGGAAQTSAQPQGKRPPQAKTQPEFDAYKAAAANQDPAALSKAADDFATKFPDSELRIILYKTAMRGFQQANDGDNMMESGRKVLKIDPDDPEALVGVAEVLAERTRDTDLDKDQRLDEAMKLAQHATETVDTDIAVPAGTPQDKIDAYKGFLRSSAYAIMGTIQYNKEKYAEAEGLYRKSIDAYPSQPDPIAVLRLALCLDKQNKYPEALKEANHAVDLTQDTTPAGKMARQERDRLAQLTGGTPPAAPKK